MRVLTPQELQREIVINPDLRRLGEYKISSEKGSGLTVEVKINSPMADVYLGAGDFIDCPLDFKDSLVRNVHLGSSRFSEFFLNICNISVLFFEQMRGDKVLFGKSEVFLAVFGDSRIGELRIGEGKLSNLVGQEAEVDSCVFEGTNIERVASDWMVVNHAVIPNIKYKVKVKDEKGEELEVERERPLTNFYATQEAVVEAKAAYDEKSIQTIREIDSVPRDTAHEEFSSQELRVLSRKEFYKEIYTNPDLRRLGPYKVSREVIKDGEKDGENIVFAIEAIMPDQDINLGQGDFRDTFVAFDKTVARSINLGNCQFSDFYLDKLDTMLFDFGNAEGSRVYFDFAKVHTMRFGNSNMGEVFCDLAQIKAVNGENSMSGLFFTENAKIKSFDEGSMIVRGEKYDRERVEGRRYDEAEQDSRVKVFTLEEIKQEIKSDPDLRRLGPYKVVENSFHPRLDLEVSDGVIHLGDGDFTDIHGIVFNVHAKRIDFGNVRFRVLNMGSSEIDIIDLQTAHAEDVRLNQSKIGDFFLADSTVSGIKFDKSIIGHIYGERGSVKKIGLDEMIADRIHLCNLQSDEIRCGSATMRELLLSRGEGVHHVSFENSKMDLVNFHEGRLAEVDFGDSEICTTSILRATIDTLKCEHLKTNGIFFSQEHFKNRIGKAEFGDMKGIKGVYMDVFFDERAVDQANKNKEKPGSLPNFGNLSFGRMG